MLDWRAGRGPAVVGSVKQVGYSSFAAARSRALKGSGHAAHAAWNGLSPMMSAVGLKIGAGCSDAVITHAVGLNPAQPRVDYTSGTLGSACGTSAALALAESANG